MKNNIKKLTVSTSEISNRIYAGSISKDKKRFLSDQQDVTLDALVAVAQHAIRFGNPIEITKNGELEYRIIVEKIS